MTTDRVSFHAKIAATLIVVLLIGVYLASISSKESSGRIMLVPGKTSFMRVRRPLPDVLILKIEEPNTGKDFDATVTSSGEYVNFSVSVNGSAPVIAEAKLDTNSSDKISDTLYLRLKSPSLINRNGANNDIAALSVGRNKVAITVDSVSSQFLDQSTKLKVVPPLSFKNSRGLYDHLSLFFLWPIWLALILAYVAAILFVSHTLSRDNTQTNA